jgi:hypothetical protein
VLPLCHCTYARACHQIPLVSPNCSDDGEESGALNSPEHFSQKPHYIHDEMIDASPNTGPNNIHDYVPEDDVSIILNTESLFEEQDEIMDMAADSNVMIFSPIKKALQYMRHHSTNPSHDSKSVCTGPTVDTKDSLG